MKLNKRKIILLSIVVIGAIIATGVLFTRGGSTSAVTDGFGFENNIQNRKSADKESVVGCMQSCQEMLAGWQEMNPNSKNYTRQKEKIEAKAQQCLGMNTLAGLPFSEEEILASCGLTAPRCVEVSSEQIRSGACGDSSLIRELNLPQCCSLEEAPSGDLLCGIEGEWVVGVAAVPTCYIPGS